MESKKITKTEFNITPEMFDGNIENWEIDTDILYFITGLRFPVQPKPDFQLMVN